MVNGFVVGLFLFFEPVTMCHSLKKCTCYGIIVNMKGCVKGPASFFEDCILKPSFFFFFFVLVSTVLRLKWHTIK